MDGDITYLPYQPPFADLDHAQAGDGGGPGSSNFVNGYPYDLIDEVPVSTFKPVTTSLAKGGAVHYNGGRARGSYPSIDRAYYYRVDGTEVITQSYWGSNIDVYFQTLVKSDEASIWGYGPNGKCNFKAKVEADKSFLTLWEDGTPYKTIYISTEDFPSGTTPSDLKVKLREIEICEKDDAGNPKKMLVLCSEPYKS